MENESPTKSFTFNPTNNRSIERNVLKEINHIEETTKSTEIHTKETPSNVINTSQKDKQSSDVDLGPTELNFKPNSSIDSKSNNLNETCTLNDPENYPQDVAVESTNVDMNEMVASDPYSPNSNDNPEFRENNAPLNCLNVTQVMKVDEDNQLGANLTTDSLELAGEMDQCDPSTPPDKCLPVDAVEQIFSTRKAPRFSEMFLHAEQETSESATNKQWDVSFVVEKTDLSNEKPPNKNSSSPKVSLVDGGDGDDSKPESEQSKSNDDLETFDFKQPDVPLSTAGKSNKQQEEDDDNCFVLNSNNFDFLLSRGTNQVNAEDGPRSSLLLSFDPLTRRSLYAKQTKPLVVDEPIPETSTSEPSASFDRTHFGVNEVSSANGNLVNAMDDDGNSFVNNVRIETNGDKIVSVDGVLLTNKKVDITSADENIQKKMEEYEATQEILLKRITEKDKAITKTSNVLELYEKAISEALAAKEKLSQNYDKENEELKNDRDVNHQHLVSLESTFADLHMKFERNVQYTGQLQEKLNAISEEKSKAEELLRQQELRYDKMKSHTMQQFDIANAKYEQQSRAYSLDNTKLKAQIKRDEIHKNAVAEELSQKKRENDELVKICDELISGQRN